MLLFVSVFIPVQNIYKYGLPIKEFFIWGMTQNIQYVCLMHYLVFW